jgi:pimeloyl-ACP methyl ester carboxylesterase
VARDPPARRCDAAKDLEVYGGEVPPPDFSLGTEVAGIERVAQEAGFERFHLVGYSAGGAASLAFAAAHPERLLSLALMEPAFAGRQGMTPEERAALERFRPLLDTDGTDQMSRFQALQLADGVDPPPPKPGPPPAWMTKRPAGVRAYLTTFLSSDLDLAALRSFDRPVWYALGGRSNPDLYARMADRLSHVFPDFTTEVYPDRHHFDPPHRIEPAKVAASLRAHWARAHA